MITATSLEFPRKIEGICSIPFLIVHDIPFLYWFKIGSHKVHFFIKKCNSLEKLREYAAYLFLAHNMIYRNIIYIIFFYYYVDIKVVFPQFPQKIVGICGTVWPTFSMQSLLIVFCFQKSMCA
jgi:hypothetical protein